MSGANRTRTGDLLVANQALSQLSYGPNNSLQYSLPTVWAGCRATSGYYPAIEDDAKRSCLLGWTVDVP